MEEVSTSETLVSVCKITWHDNQGKRNLHTQWLFMLRHCSHEIWMSENNTFAFLLLIGSLRYLLTSSYNTLLTKVKHSNFSFALHISRHLVCIVQNTRRNLVLHPFSGKKRDLVRWFLCSPPWSWVRVEKLILAQLLMKFNCKFFGTRRFITVFTDPCPESDKPLYRSSDSI
jgi:hypothetical protein